VISLVKSETTAVEAARRHGLKVAEVEDWRDRFLLEAENALRAPKEDEALREEELNRFKRKVGELTTDLDILRTASRLRPTTRGTSSGKVAAMDNVRAAEAFPPAISAPVASGGSTTCATPRTCGFGFRNVDWF
jgi:hypothetical protein